MMMIITTICVIATTVILVLDVEPFWIQYTAFAISLTLFLMTAAQNFTLPTSAQPWLRKQKIFWTIIPFLVLCNFLARKYEYVWDFSEAKLYSLRSRTLEWISQIKDPVRILIFLRNDNKTLPYAEWLKNQIGNRTDIVQVEVHNINREVLLTKQYEVSQEGETVLVSGQHWVKVKNFKEEFIVPGLVLLSSRQQNTLCYILGHGEPDPDNKDPENVSMIKSLLEDYGYRIQPISLRDTPKESFSKTCGLVIWVSPKLSLFAQEVSALERLLTEHIPFFIALDTPAPPEVEKFLAKAGVGISDSIVANPDNLALKRPVSEILTDHYGAHPTLQSLNRELYLPMNAAITFTTSKPYLWQAILSTPYGASYHLLQSPQTKGPFHLVAAATKDQKPKIILVGSGKAFINRNISYVDNRFFVLNSIRWLLEEKLEEWTMIRPRDEKYLSFSSQEMLAIQIALIYGIPALVALQCLWIWIRQRRTWQKS